MSELNQQVAVVTGGAQGIGREICLVLAREGASLVVGDMNFAGAEETASLVQDAGGEAVARELDVSDEASVLGLYESLDRIDILVNNAGICAQIPILEIEVGDWDRMMAVNLRGTFLMSREALRVMKSQRGGSIVNIGSLAAKVGGLVAGAHYSASKAGVVCLTKSLALQGAPHKVRANAIAPGPAKTEMTAEWTDEDNAAFKARIPLGDYAEPEDIANAVAFLCSPKSRYITGEVIDVNGGSLMD
jgi:3-oxoacyl-[acyl-carrier protein] reductase